MKGEVTIIQVLDGNSQDYLGKDVRCRGNDGKEIDIMPFEKALELAKKERLELIEVTAQATPPVVRILDFKKYRYEQKKRDKEQRKKQKTIKVKEIKFHVRTDTHDFNTKANHAIEFLKKGYNVKLTLHFRGREMTQKDLGKEIIDKLAEDLSEYGSVEGQGRFQGRFYSLHMIPAKKKK